MAFGQAAQGPRWRECLAEHSLQCRGECVRIVGRDEDAAALQRVLDDGFPRPRPLRSLAERHAPARVAAIYASTYRALVASEAAGARAAP